MSLPAPAMVDGSVHLPAAPAYDVQDALMGHQTLMKRVVDANDERVALINEYVNVCINHADNSNARDTHGDFVVQLEAMRAMLFGQRMSKAAPSGSEAQRVYIVRGEWGREFYTRAHDAWNAITSELAATTTELAAHWVTGVPEGTRYGAPVEISERTLLFEECGLVLQRYPTIKSARKYVNALHAVVNAPLSRVCTPYGCAVEVLGSAFVGLSLVPIKSVSNTLTPSQDHMLNAVFATLRLFKTGSKQPPSLKTPNVLGACGTDGRFYILDPTELPQRSDTLGNKAYTSFPRREMSFGVAGITTSPSSPVDFTQKYRMRPVFEHLLSLTGSAQQSVVSESFTSRAMHANGVPINPFFGHVYGMLIDQEKQFQKSHDVMSNQQSAVMRQQYVTRKRKFETCRAILLTEAIARVVKRCVREVWRRLCADHRVVAQFRRLLQDEEDDPEALEKRINNLYIAAANNVLNVCLPTKTPPNHAPGTSPVTAQPSSGGTHRNDPNSYYTDADHEVFKELLFIANDAFIKRPLDHEKFAFTGNLGDVDYGRAAFCLGEQLGVPVTYDGRKVELDRTANVLDQFFNLDSQTGGPLRLEPQYTAIELPVCFKAHSKAKLLDFAALQTRIASKVAQDSKSTSEQQLMARFIHLLSADVTAAHRGASSSMDYDEVLTTSSDSTVANALPYLDLDVAYRKALLMGVTEPPQAVKALGRFTDKCRPLITCPEDTVVYLAPRIIALCRLVEYSNSNVLVSMLQGAVDDLNALSGYIAPTQRRKVVADPTKTTLRIGQCAHLYLPPLTILVRCVLQPDPSRSNNERFAQAIQLSMLRRDVIVAIYGEESYEAGVAADNIGSICSNNRFDLERAEEEFEKAVAILSKAEPEGPAVFVTQNNLAFLYLRKAEMLKRNLKGLNERDLLQTRNRVRELLEASETLLRRVLDAEGSVAPLDFATACNNLANIMLFRSNYSDAAKFFEKTLAATEKYANTADEPHCRLHAQKNLKVLARRRYMNAVLRIQTYVRRFVTKLRNRKSVLQTKAALEVQRIGRAYLDRVNGAVKYRFSAFHYWIRQPSQYGSRLPPATQDFAADRKKRTWEEMVDNAAYLLQRVLRGHNDRSAAGHVLNFQVDYANKHRTPFEREAENLRAEKFSEGSLQIKLVYANQQQYELFDIQQRSTKLEALSVVTGLRQKEMMDILGVMEVAEYSGRRAITHEWGRVVTEQQQVVHRRHAEDDETRGRLMLCGDYFYGLHNIVHDFLVQEEELVFATKVQGTQGFDFIVLLEHRMRAQISREEEVAFRGVQLAYIMPRIGRGYLLRRGFAALKKLLTQEHFRRELIESEERVTMSFDALNKRWDYEFHEFNEQQARGALLAEADQFWKMDLPMPVCILMKEYRWRLSLTNVEMAEFADLSRSFYREAWVAEERARRRRLVDEAFLGSRALLAGLEADMYESIMEQARSEFRVALLASIDFAIAYVTGRETRERRHLLQEEARGAIELASDLGGRHLIAREEVERSALLAGCKAGATAVTQRDYMRRVEAAARQTVVVYQQRSAQAIAAKHHAGERAIEERKETRGRTGLALAELESREALVRAGHSSVLLGLASRAALSNTEVFERRAVELLRENDVRQSLSAPMARSLHDIQRGFVERSHLWEGRSEIAATRDRSALELEHFHEAVQIAAGYDARLAAARVDFDIEATKAEEASRRREIVDEEVASVRALFATFLEQLRDADERALIVDDASERLPLYVEREAQLRELINCEVDLALLTREMDIEETVARERVLCDHEVQLMSIFLMAMHSKWVTRLWLAQQRTLNSSLFMDVWAKIESLRRENAASRLQRLGRAYLERVGACDEREQQFAAAIVIQRAGRGYVLRRALPFLEAEEIEHCMLYAREATDRSAIEDAESRHWAHLRLFGSLNPQRFVSSGRRAGSAKARSSAASSSPSRQFNTRIYGKPAWASASSMFDQAHSARYHNSGTVFAPAPPRGPVTPVAPRPKGADW